MRKTQESIGDRLKRITVCPYSTDIHIIDIINTMSDEELRDVFEDLGQDYQQGVFDKKGGK